MIDFMFKLPCKNEINLASATCTPHFVLHPPPKEKSPYVKVKKDEACDKIVSLTPSIPFSIVNTIWNGLDILGQHEMIRMVGIECQQPLPHVHKTLCNSYLQ